MNDQDQSADLPVVQPQSDSSSASEESNAGMANTPPIPEVQNQSLVTEITLPEEAGDSDLIEKEWVERAKEIVEHTRDDPHEQQKALSLMKDEYMKKRYNRDPQTGDS